MEHELSKIVGKPNDYKFCPECERLNWYENDKCIQCQTNIEEVELCDNDLENDFEQWVKNEYDFWIAEGYAEEEADGVLIEI